MIAALCLTPLSFAYCASIAVHVGAIVYYKEAQLGTPAGAAVSQVDGKNGQRVNVRLQTTNDPAQLPADFSTSSAALPTQTSSADLSPRHVGVYGSGANGSPTLDQVRSWNSWVQSPEAAQPANRAWVLPVGATPADLAYRFDEHMSCEQSGNCTWNDSGAVRADKLDSWRLKGRPGFSRQATYSTYAVPGAPFVLARAQRGSYYQFAFLAYDTSNCVASNQAPDVNSGTCVTTTTVDTSPGICDFFIDNSSGTPAWRSNMFDPDCVNAADRVTQRTDGGVDIDQGAGAKAAVNSNPDGTINIAQKVPNTTGGEDVTKVVVNPGAGSGKSNPVPGAAPGVVEKSSQTKDGQSVASPLPPGSGTGSGTGTGTGTGAGSAPCGGPSQPVCKVEMSGKADLGSLDGDGASVGPPSGVSDKLNSYSKATFEVSSQCPADAFDITVPFPSVMGGPVRLTELTPGGVNFCTLISPWEGVIRAVEFAAALVGCAFIVLRA